jgi:antitoxin component YwqK of YwqJK toxin-antitoxin module
MEDGIELINIHNCYICLEPSSLEHPFVRTGCSCRGGLKIHKECFKKLGKNSCSICKKDYGSEALDTLIKRHVEYYDNGEKYMEVEVICDTETQEEVYHGEGKYYLDNGKLWLWCNYNNGVYSKFYRIYDNNGNIQIEQWFP